MRQHAEDQLPLLGIVKAVSVRAERLTPLHMDEGERMRDQRALERGPRARGPRVGGVGRPIKVLTVVRRPRPWELQVGRSVPGCGIAPPPLTGTRGGRPSHHGRGVESERQVILRRLRGQKGPAVTCPGQRHGVRRKRGLGPRVGGLSPLTNVSGRCIARHGGVAQGDLLLWPGDAPMDGAVDALGQTRSPGNVASGIPHDRRMTAILDREGHLRLRGEPGEKLIHQRAGGSIVGRVRLIDRSQLVLVANTDEPACEANSGGCAKVDQRVA